MNSEQDRFNLVILVLVAMVAFSVMYFDWRTRGEIELLHQRVDAIDTRPVARILRARDDATAEAVAREGT